MTNKNINTNKNNINIKIDLDEKPKRKRRSKPKEPTPNVGAYPVYPAISAPPTAYNTFQHQYYTPNTASTDGSSSGPSYPPSSGFDSLNTNRETAMASLSKSMEDMSISQQLRDAYAQTSALPSSKSSQADAMAETSTTLPSLESVNQPPPQQVPVPNVAPHPFQQNQQEDPNVPNGNGIDAPRAQQSSDVRGVSMERLTNSTVDLESSDGSGSTNPLEAPGSSVRDDLSIGARGSSETLPSLQISGQGNNNSQGPNYSGEPPPIEVQQPSQESVPRRGRGRPRGGTNRPRGGGQGRRPGRVDILNMTEEEYERWDRLNHNNGNSDSTVNSPYPQVYNNPQFRN